MRAFLGLLFLAATAPKNVVANHMNDCVDSSDVGNYFINFCEEKCVCELLPSGAYAHVCYREREEFTCMATDDRERFLNTYKAVTTPGHPQYELMEELLTMHGGTNFGIIHQDEWFLPWHRYYAMAVEDVLRNEDCRVTLPWWRWSKKSATWWTGSPFLPASNWLGTQGSCVTDGAFAPPWNAPGGGCLSRFFNTAPMPSNAMINSVLLSPPTNYDAFSYALEGSIHNSPHCRIGGTMCSALSPRDPVFFLHHGYIDQLWDRWQRKTTGHMTSYSGSFASSLPVTYGTTPDKVGDHFQLKQSRVIYVNLKSKPIGRGHIGMIPFCLLFVIKHPIKTSLKKQKYYDITALEDAVYNYTESREDYYEVPQLKPETPSYDELRERFDWWYKANPEMKEQLDRRLEKLVEINQDYADAVKNPVDQEYLNGLDNPSSALYGLDLDSDQFNKILLRAKVCDYGSDYKNGKCKRNNKRSRDLQKAIKKKGKIVGGEVYQKKDAPEPTEAPVPTLPPTDPSPQCGQTCEDAQQGTTGECVAKIECRVLPLGTNCRDNPRCGDGCLCRTTVRDDVIVDLPADPSIGTLP